jgi:hypothetical protein
MSLTLLNPNDRYANLRLRHPPTTGYIHLAAAVEPTIGRTPLPRQTRRKHALLNDLKRLAARLAAEEEGITKATVYTAALIPPPGRGARERAVRGTRYDVAILIETLDTEAIASVMATNTYSQLQSTLFAAAQDTLVMPARCARLIADVDKSRDGLFLFNYFKTADAGIALELWEHLAAWYQAETGMDNSTLLAPLRDSPYVFVNHARWDRHLATFMLTQFSKPTFRSFVVANLKANHTTSSPILFHLA